MKNSTNIFELWSKHPSNDPILESSLKKIKSKPKLIEESFGKRMEFGTAGIRGILGAGTNKINVRTISAAAAAYAQYLIDHVPNSKNIGVVIGHDNRHNNQLFSKEVARVFSYYKIKTYLFEHNELQPTPLISYAIRKLKTVGGVVITASHNPAKYNGFKIYNELGGQLTEKYTKIVSANMNKINFLKIPKGEFKPIYINHNLIDNYVHDLLSIRVRKNDESQIKLTYSPLHGTGYKLVPKLLQKMDIQYYVVKSQMTNDPNFSKTKSPNPEDPIAYKKAIKLAKKTKSDIIVLTDPDADRIGVVVKHKRRYKYLNGNQIASLYLNYRLTNMQINGGIPNNSYIVKSNVSSDFPVKIAKKFGVNVYETHVGFKNIAELIEQKKNENFIFGFEESFGFLIDPNISRDKDAIQGLVAIAEMANYYKTQGIDLFSKLLQLYYQFNFHHSITISKHMTTSQIKRFFARILKLKKIGGKKIVKIEDYRDGIYKLPKTNMVKIYLENFGWIAIRPSGTEPKVKFYYNLHGSNYRKVVIIEQSIKNDIEGLMEEDLNINISKKTIFKFFVFTTILLIIMVILLFTVYDIKGGEHGTLTIFIRIWHLMVDISTAHKFWIILLILTPFLQLIPSALFIKRAMHSLGKTVKFRHAFISTIIAISISAVTPFATGGAIASYWYLRKKGHSRDTLLSAFLMNSLIYQFTMVLRTFLFVPLGFWIFKDIYFVGGTSATFILVLTMIGFLFDCFSTIMIALLTMNKRIQNSLVNSTIVFLEWLPFISIPDPLSKLAKYEHEFYLLRGGMKKMTQNKLLMFELLGYESINIFYSGYLFAALAIGSSSSLVGGTYLEFLTGTNLLRSANNMIPTPGSSGTTEWMSKEIFQKIFGSLSTSAEFTGLVRFWTYIFPLGISGSMLFLIYFNEKFNRHISIENKNNLLVYDETRLLKNKFRFYLIYVLGPISVISGITFLYFLFR